MERQLRYYIVLPLKEIILRKVVAYLWNGSIFDPGEKLRDVWDVFEGDVKEKVSKLKLPQLIKNRMMNLVKPIGSDILNWQVFHEDNFVNLFEVFNIHTLQHLQRTCTGLIDYRRTAEELVRHEIFDTIKCFELACLYCLEDIILLLWGKFSEEDKNNFLRNVSISSSDVVRNYWAYILRGDESILYQFLRRGVSLSAFYNVAFEYSARKSNKSATEYFFHRLRDKEKKSSFLSVCFFVIHERFRNFSRTKFLFSAEKISDVLCYLLSVMTSEQQMQALVKYNHHLLISLLDWHLESIFFDIADLCWKFLPEEEYGRLLYDMREFIIKRGYYIPHMFQNFFLSSPRNFRKRFVERECRTYEYSSIFSEFLRAEDTETIEIIFKNIDATDRECLIFSVPVCKYLSHFILSGKWSFVEVCIRAAMLSKEDRKKLEGGLMYFSRSLSRGIPTEWSARKLKGFFEFLNEMHASWAIKRSAIDEDSHEIKKLCSGEN